MAADEANNADILCEAVDTLHVELSDGSIDPEDCVNDLSKLQEYRTADPIFPLPKPADLVKWSKAWKKKLKQKKGMFTSMANCDCEDLDCIGV